MLRARALRNALLLLRSLLADSDASPSQHSHLLSEHELLGLNPQAPVELDLDVVQQAYTACPAALRSSLLSRSVRPGRTVPARPRPGARSIP